MRILILTLLFPTLLFAQDFVFTQEYDSIEVEVDGFVLATPWTGGYANSSLDLCDIDNDADFDLFVGSTQETIHFFENQGSSTLPQFDFTDGEFGNVNVGDLMGRAKPVFWDMDSDGDFDLFVGTGRSLVRVYRNIGDEYNPIFEVFEDTLRDASGDWFYCDRPQFVDIDDDGDEDLFCGRYPGTIDYYENIGDSTFYSFQLGGLGIQDIDVGFSSSPEMVDIDADNDYDLFIGNKYGKIWYYENIGDSVNYNFMLDSSNWLGIDVGDYASPEFCDIDGDGDYDLFIGKDNDLTFDIPGAIHYWENIGTPQNPNFIEITQNYLTFDAGHSARVDLCDIDNDDDLDLFFLTNYYLGWMKNEGTSEVPYYDIQTFNLMSSVGVSSMDLGDFTGDGIPDLVLVDEYAGDFTFYENVSTPDELIFQEYSQLQTDYVVNEINLIDIDGDGDKDLLFGAYTAYPQGKSLVYYENIGGSGNPTFVLNTENLQGINSVNITQIIPRFADVDLDQDYDLFLIEPSTAQLWYFENIGTPQQANLDSVTNDFLGFGPLTDWLYIDFCDIDDDDDMDLFAGRGAGGTVFFRNTTGDTSGIQPRLSLDPRHGIQFSIGPNPANPITWISYNLPYPQKAEIAVYNLLGQKVATLASGLQIPGERSVVWNTGNTPSGVYFIRFESSIYDWAGRIVVVK